MKDEDTRLELFSPVHSRSAADEVLAVMVDALRGGLFDAGDILPSQASLAHRLKVSRRVLREAIEVLREEGIVSVKRGAGGGMMVASTENLARVSSRIQGPTRATLVSLMETRRLVECHAVFVAAEVVDEDDIRTMRRMVAALGAVMSKPLAFWELDIRFHFFVADATRNPVLGDALREIFDRLAVLREPFPYAYVPHVEAMENQRGTLQAIESRDPVAALASMDSHLGSLENVLLGRQLPLPFNIQLNE